MLRLLHLVVLLLPLLVCSILLQPSSALPHADAASSDTDASFLSAAAASHVDPMHAHAHQQQQQQQLQQKLDQETQRSLRRHQSRALAGPASSPPRRNLPTLPPPPPPKSPPSPPRAVGSSDPPPSSPSAPPLALSMLWGGGGEMYRPSGPLTDVSWAGYKQGTVDPPSPPVTFDLRRDFGAIGNGFSDDTNAWDAALNATPSGGVLYVPPGTYMLTRPSTIFNKGIIIRGAGVGLTTLYYPNSFKDLFPSQYDVNIKPSPFNSGPFFLNFGAKYTKWMTAVDGKHWLANITGTASRGDYFVTVSSTRAMKAGQWVQVLAYDRDLLLTTYMYGGTVLVDQSLMCNASDPLIRHLTTVKAVINATCIQITRPLPFDLRRQWRNPIVVAWDIEQVDGAGIEDLTARFKPSNYPGHLREEGYNWLNFADFHNSFVRRVKVVNADFGMSINTDFGTVDDVEFGTDYDRAAWSQGWSGGMSGHHAIGLNRARGVLVKNFRIKVKFVHDLTLFTLSSDNVFTNGSALDLSIDYHKQPMHGNLFQNLDCGLCTRLYNYSGGSPGYGLQSGMYNTWWGLYSSSNAHFAACIPYNDFGANLNFIGLGCNPVVLSQKPYPPIGWTLEHQNPHGLYPRDLYQAMRRANLNPLFPSVGS